MVWKEKYFSPRTLGKIPILTNIFQMGWFNHQLVTGKQCRDPKYTGPESLQRGPVGVSPISLNLPYFCGSQVQRRYGVFTLPKSNTFAPENVRPLGKGDSDILETTIFRCENVSFREGTHTWLEIVVPGTLTSWKWKMMNSLSDSTFFREKLGETANVAGDAIWPSNPLLRGHLLGCPAGT